MPQTKILLHSTYPLYAIAVNKDNHVIFGGGGGSSASGVPNGLEKHNLNDSVGFEKLESRDTGKEAIMSLNLHPLGNSLVCGINERTVIFKMDKLHHFEEVVSDKGKDNYQKVAKFNRIGTLMVTGGAEGCVRLWTYPKLKLVKQVIKTEDETRDLVVNENNDHLVVISSDGKAVVMKRAFNILDSVNASDSEENKQDVSTDTLALEYRKGQLKFNSVTARYVNVNGQNLLYMIYIRAKQPSYLVVYDQHYKIIKEKRLEKTHITKMVISPCKNFFAVGTKVGVVSIYRVDNLRQVTSATPHSWVVTGLAWSADSKKVVSISADASLCSLENIQERSFLITLLLLLLIVATVSYIFCLSDNKTKNLKLARSYLNDSVNHLHTGVKRTKNSLVSNFGQQQELVLKRYAKKTHVIISDFTYGIYSDMMKLSDLVTNPNSKYRIKEKILKATTSTSTKSFTETVAKATAKAAKRIISNKQP